MISHSQARTIAEQRWGTGGTHSYRTNRVGAFYFSCSGHGGFVIDARAFTPEERAKIDAYLTPDIGYEAVGIASGVVYGFASPFRRRSRSVTVREAAHWVETPVYLAEEDADWSVPVLMAGIMATGMTPEAAQACFDRWIKPRAAA